jgi:phosphoribosylformylglycinamidine cyclo-ligase
VPELATTLAEELLRPTRIYVAPVLELLASGLAVRALAHITGDGLFNLVRTEKAIGFDIEHWPEPPAIFALLQRLGRIADEEMYRAFNMGIGFAIVVAAEHADAARARLETLGWPAHVLGLATGDGERTIALRPRGLLGRRGQFRRA